MKFLEHKNFSEKDREKRLVWIQGNPELNYTPAEGPQPEKPKEPEKIGEVPAQPGVPIDAATGKPVEGKKAEAPKEKGKGPERAPDAMTGSQFVEAYKQCKTPEEKQRLLMSQVAKGALSPESLKPKYYETEINGQKVKVKMLNNLAIGVPGDSVRICTDAFTSQAIADMLGGALPTKDFQKRLYNDPSVPKVPFFTGEELEAAVNAKRKAQGLPPLNINIETSNDPMRNGVAMESGDYMDEHSRRLDAWLKKHDIDPNKVTVGSGKTVLAPYSDDGMLVFGGGLYAQPVFSDIDGKKTLVDYNVSGRIVQPIGDKAHTKIYADYSSRTDVVLSVEIDGKEVKASDFMEDPKYAATRAALFGEKSGAKSRYSYPGWMQEMVDEYKKHEYQLPSGTEAPAEKKEPVAVLVPGDIVGMAAMPSQQLDIVPNFGAWQKQISEIHAQLPKGYEPPKKDLPREVVQAANAFLDIKPFGSVTPFEYNGKRYLAVKEWHPPHTKEKGPPYVQHHGVSIFVASEGVNPEAVAVSTAPQNVGGFVAAPEQPAAHAEKMPTAAEIPFVEPTYVPAPQKFSGGGSGSGVGGGSSAPPESVPSSPAPVPTETAPAPAEKPAETSSPLSGFEKDPVTGEHLKTYIFPEGDSDPLRIHLNAPQDFDTKKPTRVILYALPAGNSIEQTIGKTKKAGQDFHYEIQQIAAQVRKLRQNSPAENIVIAYMEAPKKNPSAWKKGDPKKGEVISLLMDDVRSKLQTPDAALALSGHSAGRSLEYAFIDSVAEIPDSVKRISFLDANHAYNEDRGNKLMSWLKKTSDHFLTIISYDDRNITLGGKPVPGATGFVKTLATIAHFRKSGIELTEEKKSGYTRYYGLSGRVNILLMDNPDNKILHTETVYRNGFIYAETAGSSIEADAGQFNGPISFETFIQPDLPQTLSA